MGQRCGLIGEKYQRYQCIADSIEPEVTPNVKSENAAQQPELFPEHGRHEVATFDMGEPF